MFLNKINFSFTLSFGYLDMTYSTYLNIYVISESNTLPIQSNVWVSLEFLVNTFFVCIWAIYACFFTFLSVNFFCLKLDTKENIMWQLCMSDTTYSTTN